ncbi:hypothetical protein BWQ96_01793 [Gracilariopsis chorda]|uniref:INO80 complex subunit B-like conserved region domain-containing protein n=1 Tax=Gracilariopsis chorda TaxID=448386 RepID=A0A2V3J1X8_9FLOR|nr:hypothetical protein BWQ96_01793 [Gracilariopsis chorda]|eukprot:PXF48333.1 hypothetical protein BWQ96_01793 [Gracilariopsis chorda]
MESFSSDEVNKLPAVPRVRRSSGAKPPAPRSSRSASKSSKRESSIAEKRPIRQSARRRISKRSFREDSVNSEYEDNDESHVVVRRTSRRIQKTRKVIEEEDDDDEEIVHTEDKDDSETKEENESSPGIGDEEDEVDVDVDDADEGSDSMSGSKSDSKSASIYSRRAKKRRKTIRESSSDGRGNSGDNDDNDDNDENDDLGNESAEAEGVEIIKGQNDILAQLEEEGNDNDSEDFKSESSEEVKPMKSRRLTSRQRALQGENVKLEYSKLESPKTKKKEVQEEWDHDEEMELKRQQKARLRQMVSEKRNREKRAAMVDKVLRGVTSKRKKFTLATEARAAQVEVRLAQNEMRDGCMRYVSNKNGITLSIPKDASTPSYLGRSLKAVYPPKCERDPKTGKRLLSLSTESR